MVNNTKTIASSFENTTNNQVNFKNHKNHTNVNNMVERFVQSISQINDSGSFDTSLEVKHIQTTPQRMHHRCVTELDRESLARFVRDFEARHATMPRRSNSSISTTPKSSPYLCRKAKAIYESLRAGSQHSSRSASPKPAQAAAADAQSLHSDLGSIDSQHTDAGEETGNLQRAQPERASYRSAAKVLQFLSGKKKCKAKQLQRTGFDSSRSSSASVSPLPARATPAPQLGCQPLPDSDAEADYEEEHDDGISSAGSNFTQSSNDHTRHGTPDSSYEMHAPLLPTFKVTPPQLTKCGKNAAYEFARFLRSSLRAKRASVTKLRRSISDPDNMQQLDFSKPLENNITLVNNNNNNKKQSSTQSTIFNDTTNMQRADVIRVSHF